MSYWAVVQTETQRERLAVDLLGEGGFETYWPRIKVRRRGRKPRISPLFPNYVFVRVVDRWYPIRWTMGVVRVLMDGDRPARLGEKIMDDIRSREHGGFVKLPPAPKLSKGQKCRVVGGQFEGHIGIYQGQSPRERERVLLDLLGRSVPVELGPNDTVAPLNLASG